MNRLTGWDIYDDSSIPNEEHRMVYHTTTGNIVSKTDLRIDMEPCSLSYGADGKPHALAAVSNAPDYISAGNLSLTYTDFKKIKTLTEGNKTYTLTYGVDDQRRKSVFTQGAATTTRYYLGDYEELYKPDGTIQKIHYLRGGSMMLQQGVAQSLYYGYHDYQGSLIAWTNQSGTVVERRAYDPWGRHRNPQSWTEVDYTSTSRLNNRGYTGHEHLDAFQIINMNGRVYDPLTAQFFSPDPFVQAPDNWLNYNRYGYCFNNPMIYTDPSGESFLLAIAFGVFINVSQGILSENINSVGDFFLSVGIGALSGAAGGFAGQAALGALGISSTLGGSMLNGAISGTAGGFLGGFVSGAGNAWVNGANFTDGLNSGLVSGGYGALGGALIGGISGGIQYQRQISVFQKGCVDLGINGGDPVPATDQFLSDAQRAWYKDAPMSNVKAFTVENVPIKNQLAMDALGATGSTVTTSYVKTGKLTGMSNVYFNKNLAFSSAKQLFFTMGHEFIHVSQYAALAGQSRTLLTRDFLDMLDFHAYSYQNSIGGLQLNSFTKEEILRWSTFYSQFNSMNYINFPWSFNHSFKYPF